MRSIPQTYFVTTVTAGRRALLQSDRNAALLLRLLFHYRDEERYWLHAAVIMPDHLHALLTPRKDQTLERCLQCIKGGFSYAIRKEFGAGTEIWQRGFHEHRIRDARDYSRHREYIAANPATRGGMHNHQYVLTEGPDVDGMPNHLSR